jgi:hypothetical protein
LFSIIYSPRIDGRHETGRWVSGSSTGFTLPHRRRVASLALRKPIRVRGIDGELAIVVGRSVVPPNISPLAERAFGSAPCANVT